MSLPGQVPKGGDLTSKGGDLTPKGGDLTPKGRDLTPKGPDHTSKGRNVAHATANSSSSNSSSKPAGTGEPFDPKDPKLWSRLNALPPVVRIWVTMGSLPSVDSATEKYTLPRDFELKVQLGIENTDAREKDISVVRTLTFADIQAEADRTFDEELELQAFPLDSQLLHVEKTFDFCTPDKKDPLAPKEDADEDTTTDDEDTTTTKEAKKAMTDRKSKNLRKGDRLAVKSACMFSQAFVLSEPLACGGKGEWQLERPTVEVHYCGDQLKLRVAAVVALRRRPVFYLLNIVIPVTCIVLFAFLSFRFAPEDLTARLQVTLTMVLTLVAFKLSVSTAEYIPRLGYLTLMDWYMLASFGVVALVALQNYLSSLLHLTLSWWDDLSAWVLIGTWGAVNVCALVYAVLARLRGTAGDRLVDRHSSYTSATGWRVADDLGDFCRPLPTGSQSLPALKAAIDQRWDNLPSVVGTLQGAGLGETCVWQALHEMQTPSGELPETRVASVAAEMLGMRLHAEGDYVQAEGPRRRVLAGREKTLGPLHPDTLTAMHNLAVTLQRKGEPALAEKLQRRVLAGREKTLGPLHPDTLTAMNNLAVTLRRQGDLVQAKELQKCVLEGREKTLGPTHTETLTAMNNLAIILRRKGELVQAEELERRVLAGREKTLGPTHPQTLTIMSNLATMLAGKGELAQAEELQRHVLARREKTLGATNHITLTGMRNLAVMLVDKGELPQAEELQRRILAGCERTLGPTHPDTLAEVDHIVRFWDCNDRRKEAEAFRRRYHRPSKS